MSHAKLLGLHGHVVQLPSVPCHDRDTVRPSSFPSTGFNSSHHAWMKSSSSISSLPPCCRLNLAEGCFLSPLQSGSPGVNACAVSPAHGLFAAAGEGGLLECFDLRQRRCAGALDAAAAAGAVCAARLPLFTSPACMGCVACHLHVHTAQEHPACNDF